jgi:hypothetical protein
MFPGPGTALSAGKTEALPQDRTMDQSVVKKNVQGFQNW